MMLQQPQADDYVIATGMSHSVRDLVEVAFGHAGLEWQKYVRIDPGAAASGRSRSPDRRRIEGEAACSAGSPNVTFEGLIQMMVDEDLARLSSVHAADRSGLSVGVDLAPEGEAREPAGPNVGVIGLGYVGLPLAVEFATAGFDVTGFDVDESKVAEINAGRSYILDVKTEDVAACVKAGRLRATTDMSKLGEMDAVDICVPTPLRKTKDPDMSYVVSAAEEIAKYIHPGMLIVLESTTYPGTTAEVLQPMFEAHRADGGRSDFYLAFSPERVDPANEKYNTRNTPKVVGGTTPACSEVAAALYSAAVDTSRSGQLHAGRRDGEAAGEHVPGRQHRTGQRDCADVAPDEHRRLGSHRRGEDQAVRLHAVLPGPGPRRPLHSDRPVLSVVEGEAVRFRMPFHRPGGARQRLDAGVCRRTDQRSAELAEEGRQRRTHSSVRNRLQEGRQRHA